MKALRYNIVLRPEPEGGFTVMVPALPGCVTYGRNLRHAKRMAREAIALYLESLVADGERVPAPGDTLMGDVEVPLPRRAKLAAHA